MKKLIFTAAIALTFTFNACEKCYECTGDIPIFVNGQEVGSTEFSDSFCDKGSQAKSKVEAYESEGYTCVETDK